MLKIKNYVRVQTAAEAWKLNQDRNNQVLGGMMWMRQADKEIETAIDLSDLGLDIITETEDEFIIGAMASLNQLMENEGFAEYTGGAVADAIKPIVGVQFRNTATVGGSIYAKLGFSDVFTLFLALDAKVRLFKAGDVDMREFAEMKNERDILTHVIVKKSPAKTCYQSVRGAATDFPILTFAARRSDDRVYAAIGARPGRAVLVESSMDKEELKKKIEENVSFGSNLKGSSEYRLHLAKVLADRAMERLGGEF